MEREADRVGYGVLIQAGYAPAGMAAMFEKLDQASRLNDSGSYAYLRTHPLTVDRIGEARMRIGTADAGKSTGSLLEHATLQARARVLMDPRTDAVRRLQGLDANAAAPPVPDVVAGRDPKVPQLPDVLVVSPLGREAERLGSAYASALASTVLRDWARADSALAQAQQIAQGSFGDARAVRAVRLLAAESMLERGDTARARAALAPLRASASRPVMLLQAQIAIAAPARPDATAGPPPEAALALQGSADALQTWVATNPRDAVAWRTLGQVWARLGHPLRALRAEAEAELANGDVNGAVERLRAAQRLARSGGATDFIEASVIDSRLRDIEAQRRALWAAEGRKKGDAPQ
jgi:predicted Zn-dependent protease